LSLTAMNTIRTRAIGTTIKTWLNGKLVDRVVVNKWSDRNFHTGYAGIREAGGFSSYFDDFRLSRPPVKGYLLYLSDSFNGTSLTTFPSLGRARRQGVSVSATSCGGQPDDVAMLRAPNSAGYQYLFQSDRWDHADQNEGQATQYWEPLKFNADGSIQALTCGTKYTTVLSDAVVSSAPTLDGFTEVQDITSTHPRGQSFRIANGGGNLTSVTLPLFQTDVGGTAPNADLTVSLYDVTATGGKPVGTPITQATVAQSQVAWSPRTLTVLLAAPLAGTSSAPHQYAIVLSTTSTTGAYGTARADGTTGDVDPTGAGLVGASDGTWTLEQANDLRYVLNVTATSLGG